MAAVAACAPPPPRVPARAPVRVAGNPPSLFRDSARRTKIAAFAPKLDAHFAEAAKAKKLPGLAVGLVVDGDLVWSQGYGTRDVSANAPIDADTVFRIGSITKTFTAAAALQLRDAGRLSLDEPAARWIPELDEVVYPSRDSAVITLRALMTHSSGLPRVGDFDYTDPKRAPTEAQIVATLRGLPLERAPGAEPVYSNLGMALVGLALGRAAGMPYRDYVSTYLLRPLGMTSTVWDREAVPEARLATAYSFGEGGALKREEHWRLGASEAAGGLYSSVRDMARWAAMHLQAAPARDDAEAWPVARATLREAMTAQSRPTFRVVSPSPLEVRAGGMGFAWHDVVDCEIEDMVWHNGGTDGYGAMLAMAPARGVAIVALANVRAAPLDAPVLEALHMLAAAGVIPPRTLVPSPALLEAQGRVLRLLDRWDDAEAQRLLSPAFVASEGGFAKVRDHYDDWRRRFGACGRADGEMEATSASAAKFRAACEKGALDVEIYLASTSPVVLLAIGEEPHVTDASPHATSGDANARCPR